MTDDAQNEHVGEKEEPCSEPTFEKGRSCCLAVEADGHNIDIVAIHGIGGHQRETWTRDDDTESCWLSEVYPNERILLYGYDVSGTTGNVFTRQGIYNEANRLLTSIRVHREGIQEKRSIAFICHGIGGLIVKAAFVLASRSASEFEDIVFSTRAVVFIEYPASHKPESIHVTQERLTRHVLQFKSPFIRGYQSQFLRSLSESHREVEDLFIHSGVRSLALFFDIPRKTDHLVSEEFLPAAPLLKPYGFMEALKMVRTDDWLYGDIEAHHAETLQWLSSQVSPLLPSATLRGPETIPILDNILNTRDGSIVHIRTDADATRSEEFVSQYIRTHSPKPVSIFCFCFNSRDVRFNNITAMLRTWLCKLAFRGMNSRIWPAKKTLEYMRALQAWTEKDLFLFWYRFFMDDSESIYVMGGLDQCDSSREHFISSLQRMFSETETKLRIIVTTTEVPHAGVGDELQVSMPPEVYHELRLDANSLFTENQDDLLLNLGILFQNHPRYFNTELELRIAEILGSPGLDDDLKHMVLTWLACDHIPLDIMERRVSTRISPTPELVFECILSDMPTERRTWARQLLFWLSHAVRAIRAEEFWVISQTILDDGPNYSIQSLLRWFTGLLRIENDELHLGHPRLCTWLNSGHGTLKSRAWWRYKSNRQGHFTILKTFLKYLRDPGKHAYRSIPPGLHGCPYAVQYWHVHYQAVFAEHKTLAISARRLAFETFADTMALELFADNTAFRSWIEAYICLSDPFTAPDPSSKRPLPIAAYFGLDNLVPMLEKEYPEDLTDALIEASRKGHLQIVRHLVPLLPKQFCLQDTKLEKLIMAVTSCDNDEVVQEIVPLIPKHHPQSDSRPSWISDLLLKACWLGNEHLVGILLDLGADPRTTMQHSNGAIRPLSLAIQTNRIGVIKLLLERHASLCLDDPVLPDMLSTWASKEVIELLLANGFKVEAKSEEGWTTLQYACANGRPMVADLLLKQRPSVDYIGPDWSPPICCSLNENIRTMKVLLAHGVDANAITSRKDEGNALYYAIQNNRLDICQLLVEHNADVNYTAEGSAPSIITALFCTPKVCLDIFKLLLNSGADLERTEGVAPGSLGRTVLLVASARQLEDAPEIIKLLLKHSANINARDTDGWTPIYTAACFGHVNNLRLLMDAKADLYAACGDNKWNSLQVAYHHLEVLRILLGEGMDPFEKYEASVSTLQLAAGMNEPACLKAMLERPGERKELATAEALHGAVISSCPEDVRILLDEGSDVNRIEGTQTLLSSALAVGNEDIIRMLLEFRPQLDHEGLGDKTLLHFTTARTTVSSLKLVINAGARLDGLDNDGLSPLSWAVYHQHTTAVQYLLTKSAARLTINISGRWGAPLHQACRSGSLEMVRSLVDNGADVNLPWDGNLDGAAPISQACVRRDDDSAPEKESIIKYLLDEAGAVATGEDYATNPIHMASFSCTGDIIRLFIQHGAKPDQPDWIGRNPIHKACYNTLEALEALDRPDNDFAARDKLGCVPLHFAVLSGEVDLLNHVLERSKVAGLDINVTDNDGWTPLLWAARSINFEKVIDFLLDNGADTGARGKVRRDFEKEQDQQWSATDIATYHGLSALAEKLENVDPSTSMKINARGSRKIGKESSSSYCLGCNLSCYGTYFVCEKCNSFFLCFKCYNSKEVLHPQHDFEVKFGEKDDEELKLQSRTTELSSTIREQQEEHHSEEILDDEVVSNDED